MSIAFIGLLFAALGVIAMLRSPTSSLFLLAVASLFQAASALAIGPANVTPGHLVLGFFALAVTIRPYGLSAALSAMYYPRAGFFLLMATMWGVFTALIMPRLFAHTVLVMPLATDAIVYKFQPLAPASTNINQAIYFIGNLVAFAFVTSLVRRPNQFRLAARGLLLMCGVNVAIAIVDALTYAAGIPQILDFMRNADYSQLIAANVAGMKRLTGSFPEASSFAGWGVGLFAFALRLWRGGVFAPLSGYIAIAVLMAVILAFSSAGYVALGVYLIVVYSSNFVQASRALGQVNRSQYRRYILIAVGPVSALFTAMVIAIRPDLLEPVTAVFDASITTKLTSDSGVERMAWNMGGIRNIIETYGLGVGLGSVRVSSFLVGLPANVGIIGTILFGLFFWRLFFGRTRQPELYTDDSADIRAAARSGCFALLLAASLSATSADLGLLFFMFAGLACARFDRPPVFIQPENQPI